MNRQKNLLGFTIVELMVTVSLLAILSAMAAPSFSGVLRQNRLAAQANGFVAALNYARSETITQNGDISVVPLSGTTDWTTGWRVQVTDNAGVATDLRVFEGLDNGTLVMEENPAPGGRVSIDYKTNGNLDLGSQNLPSALDNTRIRLTSSHCPTGDMNMRDIVISPSGSATVTRIACL